MQWLSLPYSFQGKRILTYCYMRWASTGITWCPRADVVALPFCTTMEKIQPTDWVWRGPWQASSVGCWKTADTAGALKEAEETSFYHALLSGSLSIGTWKRFSTGEIIFSEHWLAKVDLLTASVCNSSWDQMGQRLLIERSVREMEIWCFLLVQRDTLHVPSTTQAGI